MRPADGGAGEPERGARPVGEDEPTAPDASAGDAPDGAEAGGEAETAGEAAPERGLLAVRLGEARFGLWIDEVLEILRTPPISRLPLSSAEAAGVTSVRGDVVPVLDLGVRLLGAPAARPGRLVLVRHLETGALVGLLVDGVETLLPVRETEVREPPAAAEARLPSEYVNGVVTARDEVVAILHLGRAAAPPDPPREEG